MNQVLAFQLALARQKDTACYIVSNAVGEDVEDEEEEDD